MNKTKWIIFAVVVLALFTGIYLTTKNSTPEFTGDPAKIITDGPIADHVFGSKAQKVVLVEYGDLQCPGCRQAYPTVKQIKDKYKDKLTFIFRNMPLTNLHKNAIAAATAAEAAGLQGKFFEMHNTLYENQDSWEGADITARTSIFEGYASAIGLDLTRFKNDLSSPDVAAKLARDRAVAKKVGVDQTPTFVLNGEKVDPTIAADGTKLTAAVEQAIAIAYPTKATKK